MLMITTMIILIMMMVIFLVDFLEYVGTNISVWVKELCARGLAIGLITHVLELKVAKLSFLQNAYDRSNP